VILVDANLLLYAYDPDSPRHDLSRRWLEDTLSGTELVRFTWLTLWAFMRISTNSKVFARPLSASEAHATVASWLEQPNAGVIEPGDRHLEILGGVERDGQADGPLVMDAALAAIAMEHGATLCTTDRDFSRFAGLDWRNPIESSTRT
jgi:toxin-antitoxin system PIN domain toxin